MTNEESSFLRELRQLLRKHMVKLVNANEYGRGNVYTPEWEFRGFDGDIVLTVDAVFNELKNPEE